VAKTTVQQLHDRGQSVWLDYISRSLLDSGTLRQLIDRGVYGLTSNPSIFEKAISSSKDYDQSIRELKGAHKTTFEIYDDITVKDVQDAADLFSPIYKESGGLDGYVSLEINPDFAHDEERTIAEGKRLYAKVSRKNIMFKVPATDAGFSAVTTLLTEGINVNVTLIFSLQQYVDTVNAYLQGIERLLQRGGGAHRVRSVASVFVSRVDTMVDDLLDAGLQNSPESMRNEQMMELKGRAAVANATMIYHEYRAIFSSERFRSLQKRGGDIQRLLWGSTSTKNPAYSDTKYVTELIGNDTINTIPQETLKAFLDHGEVRDALPGDIEKARAMLATLGRLGIVIDDVCEKLLNDGVVAFQKSFHSLLRAIEEKSSRL
jgi:transaldolase